MSDQKADIDQIIKTVGEMRGFFEFGDEIVPFLEDLFKFLQRVMPLMAEVSSSLHDTNTKMTTAFDRLSDVNLTTEMATNEILDNLEQISGILNELSINTEGKQGDLVQDINEKVTNIMLSMQFQDITSQKLEHADRILKATHEKFSALFESLEHVKFHSEFGTKMMSALEEDIDREGLDKDSEEFDKKTEDTIRSNEFSQGDIDSLFD